MSHSYKEPQKAVDEHEEVNDELLAKVNVVLAEVYEEDFNNLEEAVEALIGEYHEAVEEDDEYEEDVSDGSDHVEHAQPMTELDRELQIEEGEEDEDVSDGSGHVEQVHAIAQDIERQIAERALQIAEERELQKLEEEENENEEIDDDINS